MCSCNSTTGVHFNCNGPGLTNPEFKVGQIWETDSPYYHYVRIVCLDRHDSNYPIIACYSNTPDMKSEGVVCLRSDGKLNGNGNGNGVTKLYTPKITKKTTLYLWQKPSGDVFLTQYGAGYSHLFKVVAKREIELTEGEGM